MVQTHAQNGVWNVSRANERFKTLPLRTFSYALNVVPRYATQNIFRIIVVTFNQIALVYRLSYRSHCSISGKITFKVNTLILPCCNDCIFYVYASCDRTGKRPTRRFPGEECLSVPSRLYSIRRCQQTEIGCLFN